jgi:3-oxoacyl-[acyl-carrier protein] reductase
MLQEKNALVTGASRGIGRAIALELARQGANVAIVYAGNEQKAKEVQEEIQSMGRKAEIYRCNVADFEATKELVSKVLEDFGGLDILVNNAGIVKDGMVLSMKEEDFDQVLDINLKGAFHMIKHTYSHFMRKRAGRIINITSVVGLNGNAGQANYSSSKAGMIGLTKSVAKELGARGVTCNAVAPGYINTEMTEVLSDKVKDAMKAMIPMRKPGEPEDIAKAVAFLASDSARYITGEVLRVDGGMAM